MIHTILPYNPVIRAMRYHKEVIHIEFKAINYIRSYNISMELAYKLFYSKTAAECLKIYNEIKKNCTVIQVNTIK